MNPSERGVVDGGNPTGAPQIACDRCTQGVMDSTNPHLTGECGCECHSAPVFKATLLDHFAEELRRG